MNWPKNTFILISVFLVSTFCELLTIKSHYMPRKSSQICQLSQFRLEAPALEALTYLLLDFSNLVETPDFVDIHTKICK